MERVNPFPHLFNYIISNYGNFVKLKINQPFQLSKGKSTRSYLPICNTSIVPNFHYDQLIKIIFFYLIYYNNP